MEGHAHDSRLRGQFFNDNILDITLSFDFIPSLFIRTFKNVRSTIGVRPSHMLLLLVSLYRSDDFFENASHCSCRFADLSADVTDIQSLKSLQYLAGNLFNTSTTSTMLYLNSTFVGIFTLFVSVLSFPFLDIVLFFLSIS